MSKQLYPEPTVGALIFNPKKQILLLKSHKFRGNYVIPGGHIELGETMEEALRREIKEETGLDIHGIKLFFVQEFVFDKIFWRKKHFIFLDFICKTDTMKVQLNDEAQKYIWIAPVEALTLSLEPYTERLIKEYLARLAEENQSSSF